MGREAWQHPEQPGRAESCGKTSAKTSIHLSILADVLEINLGVDHVVHGQTRGLDNRLDVVESLPDLRCKGWRQSCRRGGEAPVRRRTRSRLHPRRASRSDLRQRRLAREPRPAPGPGLRARNNSNNPASNIRIRIFHLALSIRLRIFPFARHSESLAIFAPQ